jgi:hypothetical protein
LPDIVAIEEPAMELVLPEFAVWRIASTAGSGSRCRLLRQIQPHKHTATQRNLNMVDRQAD